MKPHKAQCVFVFICIHMSACIMHYELCIMYYALCSMHYACIMHAICIHYALSINILNHGWVNSFIILVDFTIKMSPYKAQCSFAFVCIQWVQTLCIMQLTYCKLYIFINNIGWLFPSKMTPHKAKFAFVFMHPYECIHYTLCIMHYAINILHYAWVNSLIIFVDFWHPTRHCVHLFYMHPYECIHYALCN
jgi:hypothetical protein